MTKRRILTTLALLAAGCGNSAVLPGRSDPSTTTTLGTVLPDGTVLPPVTASPKFAFEPLQTSVPAYSLEIPQASLDAMNADPYAETMYPAVFTANGQRYEVDVRLRGSSSRLWPKKSWRVEFRGNDRFDGRRKLNFIAEFQDTTLMAEKLAYDMLAAMGAPGPRAKYAAITLNGVYQGVFVDLEHVDKVFLSMHRFDDKDANIYRCGGKDCEMKLFRQSYQHDFEKKTNETEPWDDLRAFIERINHVPEPDFPGFLARSMDLDDQLKSMTMEALASNDIVTDSGSYLIHDRLVDKWTYVAWDLNNADSTWWPTYPLDQAPVTGHPVAIYSLTDKWIEKLYQRRINEAPDYLPAFSNLNTRIVVNPVLRARFTDMMDRALDELFTKDVMHARIDAMYALIEPGERNDPFVDHEKFKQGPRFLKGYVDGRIDMLRKEISRLRGWKLGLVIEEVNPNGGWIELENLGDKDIDLGGLVVTTNLRKAMTPNLPSVTLKAGEEVRLAAADLGISLEKQGEIGLFDGKSVAGMIDLLFYGEVPQGKYYVRDHADRTRWIIDDLP